MCLNLVEGEQVTITGDFRPFIVHYAETFVVPAAVKAYTIHPSSGNRACILFTTIK